jgi:hypothetical protein
MDLGNFAYAQTVVLSIDFPTGNTFLYTYAVEMYRLVIKR